jgi:hypothetical protein
MKSIVSTDLSELYWSLLTMEVVVMVISFQLLSWRQYFFSVIQETISNCLNK